MAGTLGRLLQALIERNLKDWILVLALVLANVCEWPERDECADDALLNHLDGRQTRPRPLPQHRGPRTWAPPPQFNRQQEGNMF